MLLRTREEIAGIPEHYEVIWNGAIAKRLQVAEQRPAPPLTVPQAYPSVVALRMALGDTFEPATAICDRAGVFARPGSSMLHKLAERGHIEAERRPNPKAGQRSQPTMVWMYRHRQRGIVEAA